MKKKTLNIVLDAFIVLLLITIVLLIIMIVRRGEVPMTAEEDTNIQPAESVEAAMSPSPTPSPTPVPEEPTPEEEQKQLATINDSVNIRSGPGTDTQVVGSRTPGDEVEVLEKLDSGWTKIRYNGGEAYIYTEYLDFE